MLNFALVLESNRAEMAERRMSASAIVQAFQEEQDVGHRFLASAVEGMVGQLRLQYAEEALNWRVNIAVAASAYAGRDGMGDRQGAEGIGRAPSE